MSAPIRASGGLVFRQLGEKLELLVVHRPRYDDWSLPKGKDDPGETPQQAARREVMEETGVSARIVKQLGAVEYETFGGNPKIVQYFAMRRIEESPFAPNEEVDEIAWLTPKRAIRRLTYEFDRDLVSSASLKALARTGLIFLVRHANAGDRATWTESDHSRPLSKRGHRQSAALAELLAEFGVDQILSSPFVRCEQTVEPLAHAVGLTVELAGQLAEGTGSTAAELIASTAGKNVVMCSHGDVIPSILELLQRQGTVLKSDNGILDCKKASVWVVAVDNGFATEAHYLPPAV